MKKLVILLLLMLLPLFSFTTYNNIPTETIKDTKMETPSKRIPEKFVWTKPSPRLINLIKSHEGYFSEAYICPSGYRTIGYGHRTKTLSKVTKKQAYNLLLKDLNKIHKTLHQLVPNNLSEAKYEALLSFCYNVGTYNFEKSTLRKLILENPNNPDIILEFGKWRKGGGKVLNGLVKRRRDEANLYFSDNNVRIHKCLIY